MILHANGLEVRTMRASNTKERAGRVAEAIAIAAMGKVMALLKARLSGRADMGEVSTKVKARLSG